MKVRRYFAASMRSALEMVRQEQGPDVLILSNRKVEDGVELITADGDIDEQLVQRFANQAKERVKARSAERAVSEQEDEPIASDLPVQELPQAQEQSVAPASEPLKRKPQPQTSLWSDEATIARMQEEITGLKGLLEQQLSGLAWAEFGGKHPTRARLLRALTRIGIVPNLGRELLAVMPEGVRFEDGWKFTLRVLESRLKVQNDPVLKHGGRFALCGATGVGKTLLACKLAARYALLNGGEQVALVSTDSQRLGATQQLKVCGGLMGVDVHTARDLDDLMQLLDQLERKELILIDTPGVSANDPFLDELQARLSAGEEAVDSLLVLSATTDYPSHARYTARGESLTWRACIVTKVDEAATLGPAISAIANSNLPIAYLSGGRQIPDDLETPAPRELIRQAVALAGDTPLPDDPSLIERAFAIQ